MIDAELRERVIAAGSEQMRLRQAEKDARALEILVAEAGWSETQAANYLQFVRGNVNFPQAGSNFLAMSQELDRLGLLVRIQALLGQT